MSASKLSLDEVAKVARLARLSPTPEQVQALAQDLDTILGYVAVLDEVDTRDVAPTAQTLGEASAQRADQARPGLTQDEALAAAPASRAGGFSVPKVLEVEL